MPDYSEIIELINAEWPGEFGGNTDDEKIREMIRSHQLETDTVKYLYDDNKIIGFYRYTLWPRDNPEANEWYHTPGQSPGPGVAQATPCSAAEPRGMKPCFPGTRSEIPEGNSLAIRVVPQRSEERSRHTFGNKAHTMDIAVIPSRQKQGLGKLLMADMIQDCSKNGCTQLLSRSMRNNESSIRLHQSFAFTVYMETEDSIVWEINPQSNIAKGHSINNNSV